MQPTININSSKVMAGTGMARVVATVTHIGNSREDKNAIRAAIAKRFDNRLMAVANSFTAIDPGKFADVITGILAVQTNALPFNDNVVSGFRSLSSNMFLDDEDQLWSVRSSDLGPILVKSNVPNDLELAHILSQSSNNQLVSMSSNTQMSEIVAAATATQNAVVGGDYVTFVDVDKSLHQAYIVATASDNCVKYAYTMSHTDVANPKQIDVNSIIERHDVSAFPDTPLSAEEKVNYTALSSSRTVDINVLLDYYRKVFIRSPAFYEQFAQRIRNHSFC